MIFSKKFCWAPRVPVAAVFDHRSLPDLVLWVLAGTQSCARGWDLLGLGCGTAAPSVPRAGWGLLGTSRHGRGSCPRCPLCPLGAAGPGAAGGSGQLHPRSGMGWDGMRGIEVAV